MPVQLAVHGVELIADRSGALYWPGEQALLVADLHLEKGSSFARRGQFLPPYDSAATLARLSAVVARFRPRRLFFLGDAFHDPFAGERMEPETLAAIRALGVGRELVWISGNHDPAPPEAVPGARVDEVQAGGLILRHLPTTGEAKGEIAGHLHPVARVQTRAAVVRRACFISDGRRALLPAFGAYAGGLNVREGVIAGLFTQPQVHVLGERRVLRVAYDKLV